MKRWEKFGFSERSSRANCQSIPITISHIQDMFDGKRLCAGIPRELGDYHHRWAYMQGSLREQDILGLFDILLLEHFQFSHPFNNLQTYLELIVKYSSEYFNCRWIDNLLADVPNFPAEYRKKMNWLMLGTFQVGILFTLLLKDAGALHTITSFVDGEYSKDEIDYTQADINYWSLLARYINRKVWEKDIADSIKKQSRKRPKMLLEILEAIIVKDEVSFTAKFQDYHKFFDKKECDKEGLLLFKNVNINGSVLWNYARISCMSLPELSEEIMDRIITPKSLGLEK